MSRAKSRVYDLDRINPSHTPTPQRFLFWGTKKPPFVEKDQNFQTTFNKRIWLSFFSLTNHSAYHYKSVDPARFEFGLDNSWPGVGRGNGLVLLHRVSAPKEQFCKQIYHWKCCGKAFR